LVGLVEQEHRVVIGGSRLRHEDDQALAVRVERQREVPLRVRPMSPTRALFLLLQMDEWPTHLAIGS